MLQIIILVYLIGSLLAVGISYTIYTTATNRNELLARKYKLGWRDYSTYFLLSWVNVFMTISMFFKTSDKENTKPQITHFNKDFEGKRITLLPEEIICMLTRYHPGNFFFHVLDEDKSIFTLLNTTPNTLCERYVSCKKCPFEPFMTQGLPGCEELIGKLMDKEGIEEWPNYSILKDNSIMYVLGDDKDLENFNKCLTAVSKFFNSFQAVKE